MTLLYCLLVFWPIVHADTVLIWAVRGWAVAEGVLNKRNGREEGMKKINSLSFKGSQPSEKKKEGRKRTAGSRGGVEGGGGRVGEERRE